MTLTQDKTGGVECATCHIGSLPHGMERRNTSVRAKVDRKLCLECHDKEWSPDYEEESYVSRVSHGLPDGGSQTAKR